MASLQNRWKRAVSNSAFTYAISFYNQGMITAWKRKKKNNKIKLWSPLFWTVNRWWHQTMWFTLNLHLPPFLNCWLGERHSQMMVFTKVIIMKINQGLNSFFHCCHLKKSHFVILKKLKCFHSAPSVSKQCSEIFFCYWRRDIG